MGVLNSWEKLLMKSERSISVFCSSWARVLKLSDNSRIMRLSPSSTRCSKCPLARLFSPSISVLMDLSGMRTRIPASPVPRAMVSMAPSISGRVPCRVLSSLSPSRPARPST